MPGKISKKLEQIDALYRNYNLLYQRLASHLGLSYNKMLILYTLNQKQICTQKFISDSLFLPKQTVNSVVQSLLKDDLVYLEVSKENKKIKNIYLTEKGKELAKETVDLLLESEISAAENLSDQEIDLLVKLTEKHLYFIEKEINKNFKMNT